MFGVSVRVKLVEFGTLKRQRVDQGGTSFMTHLKMIGLIGLLCLCTACSSTSMRVGMGDEESFLDDGTEDTPVVAQEPIMPEFPPEPSRLSEPPIHPEFPSVASLASEEPPPVLEFEPAPEPEPSLFAEPELPPIEEPQVALVPEPESIPEGPQFKELQDVLFDFDQARIRTDAVPYLESNAELMQTSLSEKVVLVEGHCDERGSFEYNLVLGARRAQAVRAYLVDLGVPETRIRVVSYGEERPVCKIQSEWCWQQNRRTHLVLQ